MYEVKPEFYSCQQDCSLLRCPVCGEGYLHQTTTDIFERDEDETEGLHTTVTREGVHIDSDMRGNPSSRRHSLVIHFYCETCVEDVPISLAIYQHKGSTYLSWTIGDSRGKRKYPDA